MPIGYNHLTYEQRCQIETLKDRVPHIEISGIIKVYSGPHCQHQNHVSMR